MFGNSLGIAVMGIQTDRLCHLDRPGNNENCDHMSESDFRGSWSHIMSKSPTPPMKIAKIGQDIKELL